MSAAMSDTQPSDLNEQGKELLRKIDFGFQVEAFIQGEIGQYLIKRAEGEVAQAVEELKQVNPHEYQAIALIQNRIRVAESVQYWLAEAIQSGHAAQDELIDQQS